MWQWPQLRSSPLGQDLARSPPAGAATLPPHCKVGPRAVCGVLQATEGWLGMGRGTPDGV